MAKRYRLFVGGKWVDDGETMAVIDKFTGETIAEVPVASQATVEQAIGAAHAAFPSYSRMPAHQRSKILARAAEILARDQEAVTTTICREAGKAWKYSAAEVARAVETYGFSADEAKRIHGETVPMDASSAGEGRIGWWLRRPVGVVSAITPFNFPLNLVAHKVGPALAAGCTVVLKPASTTPLSALRLGEIFEEAGLPAGVLNVVVGPGGRVGDFMTTDRRVAKITFTGSPPVGESIVKKAGLKRVTMELGNNSATIIEPDANLDDAVPRCVVSAFANSGQVCISLQRLLMHRQIAKTFQEKLVAATARLKVGNPLEKDCDVGPMIDEAEAKRAESWVQEAVKQGAKLLIGGKREGRVFWPTVLGDVRPEMKLWSLEAFAPVVSLCEYDSFDEALRLVNDSEFGLQAGVYTNDLRKAMAAVDALDVGGVMINDTSIFRVDHMPYGGNKMSGLGREGVRFAVEEMTNVKMVMIKP